jgi:hypothetical protein
VSSTDRKSSIELVAKYIYQAMGDLDDGRWRMEGLSLLFSHIWPCCFSSPINLLVFHRVPPQPPLPPAAISPRNPLLPGGLHASALHVIGGHSSNICA